ncbi:MAG: glycoside hydrolase family 3 C-terminal domain-containing protein [Prevotella sp.]|jgi:beta-glucosidase|nr:glycoside hydrolase family 3 C-terminal domain-containing protein [Prevotella sp.]MCI1280999.1 glycoside hydrolase family 3 C-terminal domain-containing protein [Prevotella sp.]
MKRLIFMLLSVFFFTGIQAQNKKAPQLGKDPIDKVVAAMTLEEKAKLLVGSNADKQFAFMATSAGATAAIPRLNIKTTILDDGPTGLRIDTIVKGSDKKYYCTGFPIATLMSSTWNTALVSKVGAAMGQEMVDYECDIILGPSLNIQRNPLNGRNFEYYSEDPVLSGKIAASMVKGIQSMGVGATIKHFAANDQQTMRMFNDSRMSQRTLREIYLKNFEIAVKEGNPWGLMSSYNSLNGTSVQSNYPLLTSILRKEWKYNGVVMTDWGDPRVTTEQIHAGNDLLMGGAESQVKDIIEGVKSGKLTMADVDSNVKYVLEYILKTRHFKGLTGSKDPDLKAHAQVAREAATEGMVLLKNDKEALPLLSNDSIALFGIGNYIYYANGLGSADVNKPYVVNLPQGLKNAHIYYHPLIDKFYQSYIKTSNIQLDESNEKTWKNWFFGYHMPSEAYIDPVFIQRRAKDCSKAIITISRNGGECLDRDYIEGDYLLTYTEKELIKNVSNYFHKHGKKVIVVLNTGGAMDVATWKDQVDGILMAWQPGEEGGNAMADVLTGKVNPSGKLPMTLANDYFDIPSAKNFPLHYVFSWDELLRPNKEVMAKKNLGYTNYEEGIWVGYRYFNTQQKPVAYPFGYGLSYTSFEYDNAKLKKSGNTFTVTVAIKNTGKVAGKEVIQLYSTAPKGTLEKPLRELKGFGKTRLLQPGETDNVAMTFQLRDLASFDESQMNWIADAGTYTLSIGASVEDIRKTISLKVAKPYMESAPTRVGSK